MGAADLQASQVDEWLREGIAAIKAGQDERARELLIRVVACDERNAQAWLWLSGVAESLEDRKVCLENVIEIDPDNAAAHKGLAWVQQQMQQQREQQALSPPSSQEVSPFTVSPEEAPVGPAPMSESPVVERTRTPVTPAAAMLEEDFASQRAVLDLEPETPQGFDDPEPSVEVQDWSSISSNTTVPGDLVSGELSAGPTFSPSTQDEFSNEYACPYCAAVTEHEDKRCRSCGKELWVKFRKYEKRSSWLWVFVAFQAFSTLVLAALPFVIYLGGLELLELFSAYGGEADTVLSPGIITVAALLATLPGLFSGAVLVGLYFRWRIVYWLFLAEALLEVIISALAMAFVHPASGIPGFASAIARIFLVFQIGGDFEWNRRRILLRADRGLKSSVEYLMRADFYTKQKMWAMAVVHIRAALSLLPDRLDCHTALAVAYIRLKRYELAERALVQAKHLAPGDPRLAELETLLNELRSGVPARVPEGQAA
jgi:Tfp pilus assembly protein PilF